VQQWQWHISRLYKLSYRFHDVCCMLCCVATSFLPSPHPACHLRLTYRI
jgi:hypothetical protein